MGRQAAQLYSKTLSFLIFFNTDGDCLSECKNPITANSIGHQNRLKMIMNQIHFPLSRKSRSCSSLDFF